MTEWTNINDKRPKHMEKIRVYVENPHFGSFERTNNAVFLWFKGMERGEFYDAHEQTRLDYVTKWKPIPPSSEECPTAS